MPLSINTNHAAVKASLNLSRNQDLLTKSMNRLASGKRIVDTSDDAGGLAIAMKLNSSIERLEGVKSNVKNATSYLDVQDGILQGAAGIIERMSELKSLSQDVLKNSADIDTYNTEFKNLQVQLYQMSREKFNGVSLFATTTERNGSTDAVFSENNSSTDNTVSIFTTEGGATGPKVSLHKALLLSSVTFDQNDVTTNKAWGSTGVKTLAASISGDTKSLSEFTTSFFSQAVENIAALRAQNGGTMSRLDFALGNIDLTKSNLEASYGQIMDVDIAAESTLLAKYQILVQASASMLAQANMTPNAAMMLIG
jgi:flagellin